MGKTGKQILMSNNSSSSSSKRYGGNNNNFGTSIDRSKLKILLCDHDSQSSQQVFNLLTRCCYQVISVSSALEVINALNSEGPHIDLILAAVDLPVDTSTKMLRYIMHNKNFRHIPVIMLSTQDESFLIQKYVKLGATDYLVKPLCKNTILNLWMHMRNKRGNEACSGPEEQYKVWIWSCGIKS